MLAGSEDGHINLYLVASVFLHGVRFLAAPVRALTLKSPSMLGSDCEGSEMTPDGPVWVNKVEIWGGLLRLSRKRIDRSENPSYTFMSSEASSKLITLPEPQFPPLKMRTEELQGVQITCVECDRVPPSQLELLLLLLFL